MSNLNAENTEQKAIDELSNYLYKHNENQIEQIIAANSMTDEEIEYMNSPYYYNYQNLLQNLGDNLILAIYDLNNKYNINHMYMDNSFINVVKTCLYINNIGFPIPSKFIIDLQNAICSKLYELNSMDDVDYIVDIEPRKYIRRSFNGKLLKKIDSYQVLIKLKKQKNKTKKK